MYYLVHFLLLDLRFVFLDFLDLWCKKVWEHWPKNYFCDRNSSEPRSLPKFGWFLVSLLLFTLAHFGWLAKHQDRPKALGTFGPFLQELGNFFSANLVTLEVLICMRMFH